jgi:hypothetical protein
MSEWGDLFTSFYNQFVLRDLLSIVLPGFLIIMAALYSNFQTNAIIDFFSNDLSILIVFIFFGLSYVMGILLLFFADLTGIFSTFYTDPMGMKKKTIRFHRVLNHIYKEEKIFANIRERYIIFMQTSGNMAWASLTSFFTVLFSYLLCSQKINNFGYNQFVLAFLFLIILFCFGSSHFHFKQYLKDWDKLIIDDMYR